jgi:hypothetical protein
MANYALIQNSKIEHVFVANSVADLGEVGLIYDVLDVTSAYPAPSVGWKIKDGVWYAPRSIESNITVIPEVTPELIAAAQPALEAPTGKSK